MNVTKTELLRSVALGLSAVVGLLMTANIGRAQAPSSELHVDPVTGDLYRRTTRIVHQPVVDERIEREERTVYRPETTKETRPEIKTTYLPITEVNWVPYVQKSWNPFRQGTVAYQRVPETRWERRSEVVNRTTMETRWVAEKRTIETPHRIVRHEPILQTDVRLVSRAKAPPQISTGVDPAIAARLRPVQSNSSNAAYASSSAGSINNPSVRDPTQSGMRTNVLLPGVPNGSPLPTTGIGIATVPPLSVYR
jgi:hypothetical protein